MNKRMALCDKLNENTRKTIKMSEKSKIVFDFLLQTVKGSVLFKQYTDHDHICIVQAFELITVSSGDIIIRQGDIGDYFYVIEKGSVDVFIESQVDGSIFKVGETLKNGESFGELALFYNTVRSASIIGKSDSSIWRINRYAYRFIVTSNLKTQSEKFYGLINGLEVLGKKIGDVLTNSEIRKLIKSLNVEEFIDGEIIIREHSIGDSFFIIMDGIVEVWKEEQSDIDIPIDLTLSSRLRAAANMKGIKMATLTKGDYFGEKALLADDVRIATCISTGKSTCISISRDDFISLIGRWEDLKVHETVDFNPYNKTENDGNGISDGPLDIELDNLEYLCVLGEGAFGKVKVY